ncbi:MAG: transcriptional repressor [Anaerolineales bacterium]|jgi:Fe2+ or Zn2+ uptake regulation protein
MKTDSTTYEWIKQLQTCGYRVTAARQTIVELLVSSTHALSPIEIYDLGRKEYPALGLVTVYRTLERLDELGLIQRVHMPDGCHRYLRATQGHQHLLLCTCCGQVEMFEGDDLSKLTQRVEDTTGYHIQDHWLQLFGLCPRCASQSRQ